MHTMLEGVKLTLRSRPSHCDSATSKPLLGRFHNQEEEKTFTSESHQRK